MSGQRYPVAAKTSAAGVSAAVSGAVLYVLQQYAFKGAVPPGIESLIYAAMPGAVAFAAAYLAPHQDRTPALKPYMVPASTTATGTVRVLPPDAPASGPPLKGMPPAAERLAVPGDPEPPASS